MSTPSSGKSHGMRHKKWPYFLLIAALFVIAVVYMGAADMRNVKTEVIVEAGGEISPDLFFHRQNDRAQILTDLNSISTSTPGEYAVQVQTHFTVVHSTLKICDTVAPSAEVHSLETYLGYLPGPGEYLTGLTDETEVSIEYGSAPDADSEGEQHGTVVLTDAAGNRTELPVVLNVIHDTTAPVIEGVTDVIVFMGTKPDYSTHVRAVDAHDPSPSLVIDDGELDPDKAGKYTIEYIASDVSGNVSRESATVTVVSDTSAPVISGITNLSIFLGETADYTSSVQVKDDYDPEPSFVIDDGAFDPDIPGVYTIIYTAADFSGNTATRTALITVIADVTAPVIEGAFDRNILAGEETDVLSGVRVSDDYDENPVLTADDGGFDANVPGAYTVTYTAVDFSGNIGQASAVFTVVNDRVAPTISGIRDISVWLGDPCDFAGNVTVSDAIDPAPVLTIDDSNVDLNTPGVYTIVYSAADFSGNGVSATAKVTVMKDTEAPVISGVADHVVFVGESVDYMAGLTVTDNRDAQPRWETDDKGIDFSVPGSHTVRFAAVDAAGNVSRTEIHIVVMYDTEAPVFSGIQDHTVYAGDTVDYISPVTVTDNRDTDLTVDIDHGNVDFNTPGSYTVTYTCADRSGNIAKKTAKIKVILDRKAPVIEGAENITVEMGGTVSYRKGVTVTDNRDPAPKLTIDNSAVNLNKIGRYKVTYTATDNSGNTSTVSIRVQVTRKILHEEDQDVIWPLADEVLSRIITDDMTDMEKGFKIYQWCRRNITYTGRSDKTSWVMGAYDAFTMLSGDCWNYYSASKALMTRAGIPNIDVLTEYSKNRRHYWNLINVGTGWYHFDSCPFSAGDDDFYMLTDAEMDLWDRAHRGAHPYDGSLYPERATESVQHLLDYRKATVKDQ